MKMKPGSLTKLGETIMHLEEMKKEIGKLVLEKGSTIDRRTFRRSCFLLSFELGQASSAWKEGESEETVTEELIDVIFCVLDADRLAWPSVNVDETFLKKMEKNRSRPH